jgi:hypothetical protein
MEDDFQFVEQVGNNRLEFAKDSIRDLGDPEDMMVEIMSILNETVIIPDVGETYTFIDVFRWGFRGVNFHWDKIRNYTWQEVPGQLHLVRQSEIQSLLDIPYAYYLKNI